MHYDRPLVSFARTLRKQQTDAERKLWRVLRDRQLGGCKFRRQFPVNNTILDFYCEEKRLAIELDGGQHYTPEGQKKDSKRTDRLQQQGITVLRFTDTETLKNMDGVLEAIISYLSTSPQPSPQRRGR